MIVVEKTDGSLAMFSLIPFREVKEKDVQPYEGQHPRKIKGTPLPEFLYRLYGLTRNEETMSEVVLVRLSPSEKEKLEAFAANMDSTVSGVLREHIRSLIK